MAPPLVKTDAKVALWSRPFVVFLLAASLSGCGIFGAPLDPNLYNCVDGVADDLDLRSAGTVVRDRHIGVGGVSSDEPTLELVLEGAMAAETARNLVEDGGFPKAGGDSWIRDSGPGQVTVEMRSLPEGATVENSDGDPVELRDLGLYVRIACY